MPTATEFQELYDNTTNEQVTDYNGTGINGRKFTSKTNGNSIFFPNSGYADGTGVSYRGSRGLYWSSSLHPSLSESGLYLVFDSVGVNPNGNYYRCTGFCVRGVFE